MKLYSYWRSSSSYRVRIALALKGLNAEVIPVNLLHAEQKGEAYRKVNPQGLVPSLVDGGQALTQSLAIIEYLEERFPRAAVAAAGAGRARPRARALALAVACEIAPLCNSGPMGVLEKQFGFNEEQKGQWYRHWMGKGLSAIEALLADSPHTGTFCHGPSPTLADCCLVPQIYNARRYHIDLEPYPAIRRIDAACAALPAFKAAHPSRQTDAA